MNDELTNALEKLSINMGLAYFKPRSDNDKLLLRVEYKNGNIDKMYFHELSTEAIKSQAEMDLLATRQMGEDHVWEPSCMAYVLKNNLIDSKKYVNTFLEDEQIKEKYIKDHYDENLLEKVIDGFFKADKLFASLS
jgi:hypothetical protein